MAEFEFVEVMRQARRLCEMEECRKCPLYNFSAGDCMMTLSYSCETDVDYGEAEKIILQWAKENPEPVYPSWEEAWKQLFPDGESTPCLRCYGKKYHTVRCLQVPSSCSECKNRPMPAEIAKKLGIKPKEQP